MLHIWFFYGYYHLINKKISCIGSCCRNRRSLSNKSFRHFYLVAPSPCWRAKEHREIPRMLRRF